MSQSKRISLERIVVVDAVPEMDVLDDSFRIDPFHRVQPSYKIYENLIASGRFRAASDIQYGPILTQPSSSKKEGQGLPRGNTKCGGLGIGMGDLGRWGLSVGGL